MAQLKLFPSRDLENIAQKENVAVLCEEFAKRMDQNDPLADFRHKFYHPTTKDILDSISSQDQVEKSTDDTPCVYFLAQNVGLKPKNADKYLQEQLDRWAKIAYFAIQLDSMPMKACDQFGRELLARLVGASPDSVITMNGLSVNFHLLLISFYQPTPTRHKILTEKNTFCSDRYVVMSQAAMRGYDPATSIIEIAPREGERTLRTEDILKVIEEEGSSIAVVCMSGVLYSTGQKFEMETITRAAQAKGCYVGWDLAHAIGNVKLELDRWGVDFAFWCSNKYLNSSYGGIGGAYVNKKHSDRKVPHLMGWWGSLNSSRYDYNRHECDKAPGVEGFRITTQSPLLAVTLLASLEIYDEAGMERILQKQYLLTGYMEYLLKAFFSNMTSNGKPLVSIITPADPNQRGNMLTLTVEADIEAIVYQMKLKGVMINKCNVDMIRVAPNPLYSSFQDVYRFCNTLKQVLDSETMKMSIKNLKLTNYEGRSKSSRPKSDLSFENK